MDSSTKTKTIILNSSNIGQQPQSQPMISFDMKKNLQLSNDTLISSSTKQLKSESLSVDSSLPIANSSPTSLLSMFNEDNHPHSAHFMQLMSMMPFLFQNSSQHLPFHYSSNISAGNNNNLNIHHHSQLNPAIKNDNVKTPTNFSIESILNTTQSNAKLINNDNVDDDILHSSPSSYLLQSSSNSPPPVSLPSVSSISYSIDCNDSFYKYFKQNTQRKSMIGWLF